MIAETSKVRKRDMQTDKQTERERDRNRKKGQNSIVTCLLSAWRENTFSIILLEVNKTGKLVKTSNEKIDRQPLRVSPVRKQTCKKAIRPASKEADHFYINN